MKSGVKRLFETTLRRNSASTAAVSATAIPTPRTIFDDLSHSTIKHRSEDDITHHLIVPFLNRMGLAQNHDFQFREWQSERQRMLQIRECPLCKPHRNLRDNQWKLGIFVNGSYHCFRCGNSGNWDSCKHIFTNFGNSNWNSNNHSIFQHMNNGMDSLTSSFDDYNSATASAMMTTDDSQSSLLPSKYEIANRSEVFRVRSVISNDSIDELHQNLIEQRWLINRLANERCISEATLNHYRIGFDFRNWREMLPHFSNGSDTFNHTYATLYFPLFTFDDESQRIQPTKFKLRSYPQKNFSQFPASNDSGLFGWINAQSNDANIALVTEGEFDAMAIFEATDSKIEAISLPGGASLPTPHILQLLQRFEQIIVWMDWDNVGCEGAELLCDSLNDGQTSKKAHIVRPLPHFDNVAKDANDLLIKYGNGAIIDHLKQWPELFDS